MGVGMAANLLKGGHRVPMPVGSLLRDRFLTLLARGGEHLDWSAIGRLPAADARMPAA
jgi:hypothetical protein